MFFTIEFGVNNGNYLYWVFEPFKSLDYLKGRIYKEQKNCFQRVKELFEESKELFNLLN